MRGIDNSLVVGLVSVLLVVVHLTTATSDLKELKGKSHEDVLSPAIPSSIRSLVESRLPLSAMMRPSTRSELRRHIRSIDQGVPQSNEQLFEGEDGIPSNSRVDDDTEIPHKIPRNFASSDMLRYTPTTSLSRENKYGLNRWYFPGYNNFARGGRADSNFIRFGRNGNFDVSGPLMNSNSANKKNNFIRLGRENPRQNNFIRLGRSGLWGNNERFGSKIGYFPDYYSNLSGSSPNTWTLGDLTPPLPYDNSEVIRQDKSATRELRGNVIILQEMAGYLQTDHIS